MTEDDKPAAQPEQPAQPAKKPENIPAKEATVKRSRKSGGRGRNVKRR